MTFNRGQRVKGVSGPRQPIATAIPPLRRLFEILDERQLPYHVVTSNEQMTKWRNGSTGISAWNLLDFADKLGCDIVVVPRQPADTQATPQPADYTHRGGGMGHGTATS